MKILILANSDMGLYKFRKELLEVFKEKKYEVYVSFPHGNMQQEIELLTDKIIYTDIDRRGTNVIKDFFLLIKYIFLIKKINPDFVLTYTIKPNLYGGIASAINKKPFIMNITGLGSAFLKTGLVKKIIINLYKFVLPNSKCVFFQNSFDQDSILKLKLKLNNYKLLPGSGVNLKEYSYMEYPPSDDVIKIL
ncbi:MAG TPA: glycosyltransferase family 1 protein, partial [Candidatus Avacidaminococcus intestinavium]|nr:glycosyltransferase family 1 protein [Candidatus Avacidaminococcus intestinavium]